MSLNHILTGGVLPLQDISCNDLTANSGSFTSGSYTSLSVGSLTATTASIGSETCGSLTVTSLAPVSLVSTGVTPLLQSTILTPTPNQIIITSAPDFSTITLATPQDTNITANMTLNSLSLAPAGTTGQLKVTRDGTNFTDPAILIQEPTNTTNQIIGGVQFNGLDTAGTSQVFRARLRANLGPGADADVAPSIMVYDLQSTGGAPDFNVIQLHEDQTIIKHVIRADGGISFVGVGLPDAVHTMSYYELSTFSESYSGPWAAPQAADIRAVRVGLQVTLNLTGVSSAATIAAVITGTALPAQFRPSQDISFPIIVSDNSILIDGLLSIAAATGVITISVGYAAPGTFTPLGNAGFATTAINYNA